MQWLISMSFLYLPHCFLSLPSQRKKEGRRPPTAPFLLYSLQLLHVPNCRFHVSRKEGVILLISHGKDALYKKLSLRQLLHGFARRPIGRGGDPCPAKAKAHAESMRDFPRRIQLPPAGNMRDMFSQHSLALRRGQKPAMIYEAVNLVALLEGNVSRIRRHCFVEMCARLLGKHHILFYADITAK